MTFRILRPLAMRLAMLTLILVPARALAAGQWQTFLRTYTCNDLIAGRDTVWIATGEAGLVRYLRSADRFESSTRAPGGLDPGGEPAGSLSVAARGRFEHRFVRGLAEHSTSAAQRGEGRDAARPCCAPRGLSAPRQMLLEPSPVGHTPRPRRCVDGRAGVGGRE